MSPLPDNEDHVDPKVDSDEHSDSEDSDASQAEPVVSLIAGRAKRAGAGNKYQSLLAVELEKAAEEGANEDDLALLFEEDEEDVEFDDEAPAEAASDVDDESSSDEEDKGPAVAEDDLEGEAALQKEERSKRRLQKRKADKAISQPTARRKKVKIDDSNVNKLQQTAERPRRKSERVSWIPTGTEAPVRASSRTLAVKNKEKTFASLVESSKRRERQLAVMEAAQKRKDAVIVKPMTQAERLAEAAKTERWNSKSLNKWEEMEKERAEKQRLRLEALQNRKLEGPVIRWYSGPAEWVGDELVHVGKRRKVEEVGEAKNPAHETEEQEKDTIQIRKTPVTSTEQKSEEVKHVGRESEEQDQDTIQIRKMPATSTEQNSEEVKHVGRESEEQDQDTIQILTTPALTTQQDSAPQVVADEVKDLPTEETKDSRNSETNPTQPSIRSTQERDDTAKSVAGFLDGIQDYASLSEVPDPEQETNTSAQIQTFDTLTDATNPPSLPPVIDLTTAAQTPSLGAPTEHASSTSFPPSTDLSSAPAAPQSESTLAAPLIIEQPSHQHIPTPSQPTAPQAAQTLSRSPPPPPLPPTLSTRNLITLLNFSPAAIREKDIQRRLLFSWGPPPPLPSATTHTIQRKSVNHAISAYNPSKPIQPVCVITNQPARYLDPLTGLPYQGVEAFRKLRAAVEGRGGVWSGFLGAWVGGTRAARGVPEGFDGVVKKDGQAGWEAVTEMKVEGQGS